MCCQRQSRLIKKSLRANRIIEITNFCRNDTVNWRYLKESPAHFADSCLLDTNSVKVLRAGWRHSSRGKLAEDVNSIVKENSSKFRVELSF